MSDIGPQPERQLFKILAKNPTSKILCKREVQVPSTINGGCPRGGVSVSRFLVGVGVVQVSYLSGSVFGNTGYLVEKTLYVSEVLAVLSV